MKIKKSFLICIIILAIFSLGVVCAEDNATLDDSAIENTQDEIDGEKNITNENYIDEVVEEGNYNSEYISNLTQDNASENSDINFSDYCLMYSPGHIYPWTWADSDGDSGPGIDIWVSSYGKYNISGNTSIYLNDKLIDEFSGEFYYLLDDSILWENYNGNGIYTVKVVYSGDDNFKQTNITYDFELSSYTCGVGNGNVYVELPSYVSGNLTVRVNGQKNIERKINATYASYMSYHSEIYRFELEGLENGENYTVEIDFKGNSKICSFTESFNYTHKIICPIDILLIDYNGYYYSYQYHKGEYYYGEDNFIVFNLPKDITNNANVIIDGKSYEYTKINRDVSDGYIDPREISFYGNSDYYVAFKVDITDLKTGYHSIVVSYPGDSKYPSDFINITLKILTEIKYIDFENYRSMSLYLPSDASGNLTVEVRHYDETDYILFDTIELKGQRAIIQLPCGEYEMKAYYTGDDYEIEEKIRPEYVESIPILMDYGQGKELKMPSAINSTLIFRIDLDVEQSYLFGGFVVSTKNTIFFNDALIDELLKDDIAKLMINQNYKNYGSYFLEITPIIETNTSYFELHPIKVNFANYRITGAKDILMHYSDSKTINLKAYDIYGKLAGGNQVVTIKIGKKTFTTRTDAKGALKFKIPNTITPGKYTMKITYKTAEVTKKITIKQILSVKTVKVKKSAKKLILTATLKKGKTPLKNKKITFKFKGKTYKAKTNKKGVAKVTIKKSVLKKLKVGKKVTYQATYLKNTVKKTVKIQK